MVKVLEVGPTSKNTHNDFLALSIFTHGDQNVKITKVASICETDRTPKGFTPLSTDPLISY